MAAKRSFFSRILRFIVASITAFIVFSIVVVLALRWIDPPITAFMIGDRVQAWLDDEPNYRLRHDWVEWSQISAQMRLAVVASEDQTFATHHGFDFKSINEALEDRESGKRVRGASTISQQVAKNLFLWSGKNFIRKGLEAWFTVLIEAMWSKQRILEVHLNVAQFGRHLFGVAGAAGTYFHKPAAKLTADEAALLAAVLPNPIRLKADKPSRYVRSRQEWIKNQMEQLGTLKL
jgi:monofunctional glycosyltransferase